MSLVRRDEIWLRLLENGVHRIFSPCDWETEGEEGMEKITEWGINGVKEQRRRGENLKVNQNVKRTNPLDSDSASNFCAARINLLPNLTFPSHYHISVTMPYMEFFLLYCLRFSTHPHFLCEPFSFTFRRMRAFKICNHCQYYQRTKSAEPAALARQMTNSLEISVQ